MDNKLAELLAPYSDSLVSPTSPSLGPVRLPPNVSFVCSSPQFKMRRAQSYTVTDLGYVPNSRGSGLPTTAVSRGAAGADEDADPLGQRGDRRSGAADQDDPGPDPQARVTVRRQREGGPSGEQRDGHAGSNPL
eukprot:1193321-Prorocentrum_minimum.AAC.2